MATKKYISFGNLKSFLNNLKNIFATKTEVDAKSDKIHTHSISDITNLQTTLNGKASNSHGTHVTYSTTAPVMDGTASVGSASTVARSDHRHPIDTSRAAQTSLDSHTGNTTTHITATERTNWNAAYTHSQSTHAPSNAEANQNAFSNIKIGDVTIAADIKTDTLTFVAGDNITITPDATNDKITISAKDTTYTLGSFGITATAAELNKLDGVTATATEINYVDGVTSNIQTQLDNKAAKSHTHTVANISDLTATAKELNYMDGVTSGVQAQLDGKASSGHTHNYAGSSSAGGAATSANKLNTNAGSATQPVYFSNGVPVATTYTLGKSVPSNAVFTDTNTHYASKNVVGATNATSNTATALTNGNVYINSVENGAVTSSHKISGSGATTVTTDANGNIVISSTDNNTTYGAAGSALGLVKSGGDVTIASGVITVNDDSHNHTIANVDNLQSSLDAKQATITGGASTITSSNLTANRALISNGSGKVAVSAVTSTELGYLDGVTSNVQTQLDGKSATSHTHKYAGSSSVGGSATSAVKLDTDVAGDANTPVYFTGGKPVACTSLDLNTSGSSASCTGNSATATKLQTARTIGLGTGATGTATSFNGTGNITIPVTDVKESYLSWGGKNISGGVSPIDAACSNIHSANRFAFAKPAGITIEYSTNGSTYSAYNTTDTAKVNLVSGNGNTYYIGARSSSTTVNDKLRITLNATNMGLYTRLRKLLINISTSYAVGSNVVIEKSMKGSESTYTTIGTYQISGWSGWNSIPINAAFGGGSNQTGNIANLRLTFGITGVNAEQTSNALTITDIIGIGDTYWSYPSTMAKTGHIYTYDSSQNTTFPANVTATTFVGALSGNATTATTSSKLGSSTIGGTAKPIYLNSGTATACSSTVGSATQPVYMNDGTITACTYTLGKSVPSNAVFTDTNTKVTNTLATTTKAYVTGTTSAMTNTGTQVFDTDVYLDTAAGQLTATTFNGTTFKGSGVATLTEVKTYLGI